MTVEEALVAGPHSEHIDLPERYWQYMALRMLIAHNLRYFEQGISACRPSEGYLAAESIAWARQQEPKFATSMVNAGPPTDEDIDASKKEDERFRHLQTEWVDLEAAKQHLGMQNGPFRIPRMPRNVSLHS
jgi:hypothetical protein